MHRYNSMIPEVLGRISSLTHAHPAAGSGGEEGAVGVPGVARGGLGHREGVRGARRVQQRRGQRVADPHRHHAGAAAAARHRRLCGKATPRFSAGARKSASGAACVCVCAFVRVLVCVRASVYM